MQIDLPEASSDILAASLQRQGAELVLTLVGAADLRVEEYFESVLKKVHEQGRAGNVSNVTVDVRELSFINSACLKSFVVWISDVRQLEAGNYTITFLQNPNVSWQQRSIKSLKAFGEDLVVLK